MVSCDVNSRLHQRKRGPHSSPLASLISTFNFQSKIPTRSGLSTFFTSTFQLSSLNSFPCHTSEESPANSNHCHTPKNPFPQVLCLPHIQDPPGCPLPFPWPRRMVAIACRFAASYRTLLRSPPCVIPLRVSRSR